MLPLHLLLLLLRLLLLLPLLLLLLVDTYVKTNILSLINHFFRSPKDLDLSPLALVGDESSLKLDRLLVKKKQLVVWTWHYSCWSTKGGHVWNKCRHTVCGRAGDLVVRIRIF